uniref:Uncharacterized protein n=1 Tax=Trichogramma kaykai TaxID=54128 RepID=A0ABD2WKS2_9HYME
MGLALVGKFDEIEPSEAQLSATRRLLERAVELGHLAQNHALLGQRQCRRTQSPGNVAYGIIKGWPHWSLLPPILARTTTIFNFDRADNFCCNEIVCLKN